MFFQKKNPIPQIWINRTFVVVVVLLALVAGYYFTQYHNLLKVCQSN